jgi:Mrp family chromosome partitioning ATPase
VEFLNEARARFNFVLLDVATFPLVADALVLAPLVDCVLTVFRLASTSRKTALEHLRDLTPAARSYAILLNGVGVSRPGNQSNRAASGGPAEPAERSALSYPKHLRRRAVVDGSQA